MTLWHSRITSHENDRLFEQFHCDQKASATNESQAINRPKRTMKKTASLASLWPRPASSPIAPPVPQNRSPYPPRISSLNRVPPLGWDVNTGGTSGRPATAHALVPKVDETEEMAPGTVHTATRMSSRAGARGVQQGSLS